VKKHHESQASLAIGYLRGMLFSMLKRIGKGGGEYRILWLEVIEVLDGPEEYPESLFSSLCRFVGGSILILNLS
jgi:hypothetical protein